MKIISTWTIVKLIARRFFPQLKDVSPALVNTAENIARISYQIDEMQPEIKSVESRIKVVEKEIDDVQKSFQRFLDRQKMMKS